MRARWLLGGLALAGLAGVAFVSWPRAREAAPDVGARAGEAPPGAVAIARPGATARAAVPRLVPAAFEAAPADAGVEPSAGNDELGQHERAQIDELQAQTRTEAATAVALDARELAAVAAIRADLDARRARFEQQIDPTTLMLEPLATAAILGNARAELRALTRALGPARAAALRDAEGAAYDRLVRGVGGIAAAVTPAGKRMLARRMLPRARSGANPIARP